MYANIRHTATPLFYEEPFYDIEHKMNLLLLLGQLMMQNGANTNQIVRDMIRAAAFMGIPEKYIQIHIAYTTLMLNINDGTHSYTAFRKTLHHVVNMAVLSRLSTLTWHALEENYSLAEFEKQLHIISHLPPNYPTWLLPISAGLACGSFAILFGGSLFAALITCLCAISGFWVRQGCRYFTANPYIGVICAAFTATYLAHLINNYSHIEDLIYAMISCTLFLIPGVPIINAIDDMTNSHIVSGITRATNTLLLVGSMSLGISIAFFFNFESAFAYMNIVPQTFYLSQIGAALLGAIGFSVIFNTPKRLLPLIGIGGILSVITRNLLIIYFDVSTVGASFCSAVLIGWITLKIARYFHTAPIILAIPSVIPMIPGVLLYRFLMGLLTINNLSPTELLFALRSGITGALIVICLTTGLALPGIIAQNYLEKNKQAQLNFLLTQRATASKSSKN